MSRATDHITWPHRCDCGRFVSLAKPHGWYACGEFGEETGYVCERCLPGWTPQDGAGRRIDQGGWCGVSGPRDSANFAPAQNQLTPDREGGA